MSVIKLALAVVRVHTEIDICRKCERFQDKYQINK